MVQNGLSIKVDKMHYKVTQTWNTPLVTRKSQRQFFECLQSFDTINYLLIAKLLLLLYIHIIKFYNEMAHQIWEQGATGH